MGWGGFGGFSWVIVVVLFYSVFVSVSMLKAVFAHPFFMRGTVCTATFMLLKASTPSFTSSPQATPTTPSYWFVFRIFVMQEPPGTT